MLAQLGHGCAEFGGGALDVGESRSKLLVDAKSLRFLDEVVRSPLQRVGVVADGVQRRSDHEFAGLVLNALRLAELIELKVDGRGELKRDLVGERLERRALAMRDRFAVRVIRGEHADEGAPVEGITSGTSAKLRRRPRRPRLTIPAVLFPGSSGLGSK